MTSVYQRPPHENAISVMHVLNMYASGKCAVVLAVQKLYVPCTLKFTEQDKNIVFSTT